MRLNPLRAIAAAAAIVTLASPALALDHFGLVDTGELFVSTDGGSTWSVRSTLPVRDARGLLAGMTSSELYLAAESGSVFRSTDAGVTWSSIGGVVANDVVALVPYPGRLVLFTRGGGVFTSTDGGVNFTPVGSVAASDVIGGARLGTALVAVGRRGDVHVSQDVGAAWTPAGTLPVPDAVSVAAFDNRLFVLTATGGVARSENLGATWIFIGALSQSGATSLIPGSTGLMACVETGEVTTSPDGVQWTWRGAIDQLRVKALASDQPHPTAVGGTEPIRALAFTLATNPVRDVATLTFDLAHEAAVVVTVHDLAGRIVARPLGGEILPPGRSQRSWRPDALGPGLYWIRARAGHEVVSRRMARLR